MHVLIVESPAKSKTIEKYLGKDYKVLASYGHIRDLPGKDGSVEPDNDFKMHYETNDDSKKAVSAIIAAVRDADSLILATDPDREGEAISWHVLEALKEKSALRKGLKVQRVTFNSITKQSVTDALKHPRELDMALINAQQARRALDYLVGFSISPVLWRKLPGSKSAGRVQSVALRLICEREQEIEAFREEEYWSIGGQFQNANKESFTARLTRANGDKIEKMSIRSKADADAIVKAISAEAYQVAEIEAKQVRRHPKPPFTTSTLQQEAARKLGFSAKKTMTLAQRLYEGVSVGGETTGLITYMRTDGIDVAPEAIAGAREHIGSAYGAKYLPSSPRLYKNKAKNAQEAHEAIRPTEVSRTPKEVAAYLDDEQAKLYELIWTRLVASQMESVVLDQVTVDLASTSGKHGFRAVGSVVVFDGFYALYHEGWDDKKEEAGESDDDDRRLPKMAVKESVALDQVNPEQHFTQPPPRYSEASLVKRLEELGIGRPSTYAAILSVLQEREYVTLDKKRFMPETRGRIVTAFLTHYFTKYLEYDFTADLEEELDKVSAGETDWKQLLHKFWGDFSNSVSQAKELATTDVINTLNDSLEKLLFPGAGDLETRRKCPTCETGVLSVKLGKFGAFIGCSNYPDCRHTQKLGVAPQVDENGDAIAPQKSVKPTVLGEDPATGLEITVRQGPYGWYVQLGEPKGKVKPKRQSIPKGIDPLTLTLEQAQQLLALPREVGSHPESGKPILSSIGRYGPYLQYDGAYYKLTDAQEVLSIGINHAVSVIADQANKPKKEGASKRRFTKKTAKKK